MLNIQMKKLFEKDWRDDCIKFNDFDEAKREYHRVKQNNRIYSDSNMEFNCSDKKGCKCLIHMKKFK